MLKRDERFYDFNSINCGYFSTEIATAAALRGLSIYALLLMIVLIACGDTLRGSSHDFLRLTFYCIRQLTEGRNATWREI